MVTHKLQYLAKERGISIVDLLIETVDRTGSLKLAAAELGVWENAIRYHIRSKNLRTDIIGGRTRLVRRNGTS